MWYLLAGFHGTVLGTPGPDVRPPGLAENSWRPTLLSPATMTVLHLGCCRAALLGIPCVHSHSLSLLHRHPMHIDACTTATTCITTTHSCTLLSILSQPEFIHSSDSLKVQVFGLYTHPTPMSISQSVNQSDNQPIDRSINQSQSLFGIQRRSCAS